MIVNIDEYQSLIHDTNKSMMKMCWTEASAKLNTKAFQKRLRSVEYFTDLYQPDYFIIDFKYLVYQTINGNEEEFANEMILKFKATGIKKIAFIKSKDKITDIIMNNFIKLSKQSDINSCEFELADEAHQWFEN